MNRALVNQKRAALYSANFPNFPPLRADDRWVDGIWMMGNNYRSASGYYGSYPPGYLPRILSMFPDARPGRILHLFSGSLPKAELVEGVPQYIRFDRRTDGGLANGADIYGEAEALSSYLPADHFDLILADPPYSVEDAQRYGAALCNRNKVMQECRKVLGIGGHLLWMDQALPMYRKDEWRHWLNIGMVRSTNHRYRQVAGFERIA